MSLGPASADLRQCSTENCGRQAVARGLCRPCYLGRWRKGALHTAPKAKRDLRSHDFMVRLTEREGSALTQLSRSSGQTLSSLLREAAIEYLRKCNVLQDDPAEHAQGAAPG